MKKEIDFTSIDDKLKSIHITANVKFGSKFQTDFAINSLIQCINAWKYYLQDSHKKNKIEVEIKFNQPCG